MLTGLILGLDVIYIILRREIMIHDQASLLKVLHNSLFNVL